jgi:hypothetical protein
VVASVTTSAALMLGVVALMVLPTMVVGNELLILGVVALVVGGWFLAHRHGHLRGVVLEKLDTNHRELLAAVEQQGNRISALEAGFARLDERTRK